MAAKIKRGDRRPGVTITCKRDGVPADLSIATTLKLLGKINGNLIINRVVTSTELGKVVVDPWAPGDTDTVGRLQLEVEATWADGTKTTFPPDKYLEVDIIPDLG